MYRISIFFALFLGALSCCTCSGNSKRKQELAERLRIFREEAIVFPDNLLAKYCGDQEPDTTLLIRPLKMVMYVNQGECEGCKMRALLPVHLFIHESKPYTKFGVVIILNPSHMESADQLLKGLRFRQTVFYDLDGSFELLNPQLPKNERFHTFLLDEHNKVILVGSPVGNEKLKKLYLEELSRRHQ